jgi:predicted porin
MKDGLNIKYVTSIRKRNFMKKKVLMAAALSIPAAAAHAQNSVTLYGILDAGLTYVNNAATPTGHSSIIRYGNGVAQASRWGMKGEEDLGGGLKTVFILESGFNTGDGTSAQGGALFGRQAFVGLSKSGVGTLSLGRQYAFSTDYLGTYYSIGGVSALGNYGFHQNGVDQLTATQLNNTVKFSSAEIRGFKFGAMYGFSNQAGAFAGSPPTTTPASAGSSRVYSFGLNYANGPFGIAAAYTNIGNPTAATPPFTVSIANINTNAVKDLRTFGVGARYALGQALLFGNWTDTRLIPLTARASVLQSYELGVKYNITPALNVAVGDTYTKLTDGFNGKWNQVNTGLDLALSKRTDVYLLAVYQKASGSNLVGGQEVPVQAEIGEATSFIGNSGTGADSQLAVRLGMRHLF